MPILMLGLAAVLAVADQLLKYLVVQNLKPIGTYVLIENFLDFTYVENRGAAFGILSDQRWFFIVTTGILMALIVLLLFFYQRHTIVTYLASALILGGGVGNLIDRILLGYVVDYIHFSFCPPVFNFADCAVVVGTFLFVLHVLFTAERPKGEPVLRRRR